MRVEQLALGLTALLAAASLDTANAAPPAAESRRDAKVTDHPLARRAVQPFHGLNADELEQWTEAHRTRMRQKYASRLKGSHKREERRKRDLQRRQAPDALARRATVTSENLINYQQDSSFYAPVYIGTPASSVNLVLDTGSSDMWTQQGKEGWDPSASSTFQNSTETFQISYGSGDVEGTLASDTVTLASQTASKQTFALATRVSEGLLGDSIEGIMGMAFKSLSTSGSTPFWEAVGAQIFGFYIRAASLSSGYGMELPGGTMTLGGTNTSLYVGDVNWSEVIDESYWLITLGGLTISGTDINLDGLNKVAVDTGTTLIGAPDDIVDQIYANIEGSQRLSSGYYTFPCEASGIGGTLHFGNQEYVLTAEQLVAGTTDNRGKTCLGSFFGFGSNADDDLQYILGDAFLKNVYTIFDNSQNAGARVGFAELAPGLGTNQTSRTVNQVVAANGASSVRASRLPAISIAVLAAAATFALVL